ncbi:unnamed protein product [Didymodactylos carnosus]|uniref:Uncharacterized protein n=1 Tax=Didymodactylos carnosus TaxID=1234261 RepID=A0A814YZL9_9BILA|nr:unnamed protein product [Didymodactylos carnosus]CAF1503921.1 unnamed protein product [Didymodactylos carnosus]CAF3997424.1 unnamed protein product [Didymodactylos carnosus]CAF4292186.1 unnamed protein product [Didymodactylos carnosus]
MNDRAVDESEKEEFDKTILKDGAGFLVELVRLIEEHKDADVTREQYLSIKSKLELFAGTAEKIGADERFTTDATYAYEIFYLYFNILYRSGFKSYLKRTQLADNLKLIYEKCIIIILDMTCVAVRDAYLTINDLKETLDHHELLLLMLNYINTDLETDLSSTYSEVSCTILRFLWAYSDKTIITPNLIKAGYPEDVIKWLKLTFSYRFHDEDDTVTGDNNNSSLLHGYAADKLQIWSNLKFVRTKVKFKV